MHHYEFICNACKKTFTKTLTIAEHGSALRIEWRRPPPSREGCLPEACSPDVAQ